MLRIRARTLAKMVLISGPGDWMMLRLKMPINARKTYCASM